MARLLLIYSENEARLLMIVPLYGQARTGAWVRKGDTVVLLNTPTASELHGANTQSEEPGFRFSEVETGPYEWETGAKGVSSNKQRYSDLPAAERAEVDREADRQFRTQTGITRQLNPQKDQALLSRRIHIRDQIVARKPSVESSCQYRRMLLAQDPRKVIDELLKWITNCVKSRTVDPTTLINKAYPEIDEIVKYAQRQPNLGMGQYTVRAEYDWGLNNGSWFVRAVHFSIHGELPRPIIEPPDPTFSPAKPWRPGKRDDFAKDLKAGKNILELLKNAVYQNAKQDAALPKNLVSPPSLGDLWSTAKDVAKGGPILVIPFAKMILGDLLDVAASNMAGPVTRVRQRAYLLFVTGFVQVIAEQDVSAPTDPFDRKYFDLGQRSARTLNEIQRYQVQLALLHYYCENPPSGWNFPQPLRWVFPDDYGRNWSPQRIGTAFYISLSQKRYLVD
jgi:hypothetical protein